MTRDEQIELLCTQVTEHYVFPDIAKEVVAVLRGRMSEGRYTGIADDEAFAATVTEDLQSVNGDKHLRLLYSVEEVPEHDAFDIAAYTEQVRLSGYGFAKVERLPGNVGYIDTTMFHHPEIAGERAVAAMTLVAGADALLFDVRRNVGGAPGMVALLCSYLFDDSTQLTSIYHRESDLTEQAWTLPYIPGPRFGGTKPVWVLTSATTFSGAEAFAYDLKSRGRAVLVGERTRGGAHPGTRYRVGTHLRSAVPNGRAINPVTGTNWEVVGVEPDIEVGAEEAFDRAYALALEHVLSLGDEGERRTVAQEAREAL